MGLTVNFIPKVYIIFQSDSVINSTKIPRLTHPYNVQTFETHSHQFVLLTSKPWPEITDDPADEG